MTVWQIAAGTTIRNYSPLFLEYDVMFLGPGDPGDIRTTPLEGYGGRSKSKVNAIDRFCRKVKPGDFVVMRIGSQAKAVGVIPDSGDKSGYSWEERFDDIHGWGLQHTRRVCWLRGNEGELAAIQGEGGLFSGRWSMFSQVNKKEMHERISSLLGRCEPRPLAELPQGVGKLLEDREIGDLLFSHGLPQGSVDALLVSLRRQRRLLRWYQEQQEKDESAGRPTEHEVVAYMVLPVLLALGWSEQLLAIEWNYIDLAAFGRTPTTEQNCVMVCEAKGMNSSLQGPAYKQAQGYVEDQQLESCRHILLTQGERFYLYDRDAEGAWPAEPSGYLNLTKLRAGNLIPRDTDAIDTLMALTPQRVFGSNGR